MIHGKLLDGVQYVQAELDQFSKYTKVCEALIEHPEMRDYQIAEHCNLSTNTVFRVLKKIKAETAIKKNGFFWPNTDEFRQKIQDYYLGLIDQINQRAKEREERYQEYRRIYLEEKAKNPKVTCKQIANHYKIDVRSFVRYCKLGASQAGDSQKMSEAQFYDYTLTGDRKNGEEYDRIVRENGYLGYQYRGEVWERYLQLWQAKRRKKSTANIIEEGCVCD